MALCVNLSLSSTSGIQFHVSKHPTIRNILFVVLCADVVKKAEGGVDLLLRDER